MRVIGLEFFKLRRKRLLLMTVLFLCMEIIWAFAAAGMSFSRHPDRAGWEPIIVMLSSMNGLFLPILSAIVVSRICDVEHKGNTWKLLLSASVRRGELYAAKYICACIILLCASMLQVLAIVAFGMMNDFIEPIPTFLLVRFLIGVMVTNMVVIALQQWMSMAVKNQAFALCLGMLGGFIGLAGDLFPATFRRFFAWTYYTGLSPITQTYASKEMQLIVRDWDAVLPLTGMLIVAAFAIYAAGSLHVSKQEV